MLYMENDINNFLKEARKRKGEILPRLSEVSTGGDANVIRRAITDTDFVAEDFYRYDSDVCEQFLTLMELVGIARENK